MNLVDYLVVAVLLVSALIGFYRGLVSTLADCVGLGIALAIAYFCYPLVSGWIAGHEDWLEFIIYLSEGSSHIPIDMMEFARSDVQQLALAEVEAVVQASGFTAPFDSYLLANIQGLVFAPELTLLADYFDQTVADATLNMISFVLCCAVSYLIAAFLVYVIDQTFRFPVLRACDGLAGAGLGLLRGYVILMVLFMLVPLVVNMLQIDFINEMLDEAALAKWFLPDNWFFGWLLPYV